MSNMSCRRLFLFHEFIDKRQEWVEFWFMKFAFCATELNHNFINFLSYTFVCKLLKNWVFCNLLSSKTAYSKETFLWHTYNVGLNNITFGIVSWILRTGFYQSLHTIYIYNPRRYFSNKYRNLLAQSVRSKVYLHLLNRPVTNHSYIKYMGVAIIFP